jgi:hypothetical protein
MLSRAEEVMCKIQNSTQNTYRNGESQLQDWFYGYSFYNLITRILLL